MLNFISFSTKDAERTASHVAHKFESLLIRPFFSIGAQASGTKSLFMQSPSSRHSQSHPTSSADGFSKNFSDDSTPFE
jgi:hypothetical protein